MSTYSLRSHDSQSQPSLCELGPPEVIPCRPGTSREGTPASNSGAQTTFLEMMGLLESTEKIPLGPTISEAQAEILSSALNHEYYEEVSGEDKFFTQEEYRKNYSSTLRVVNRYALRSQQAVESGDSISPAEARVLLDEYDAVAKVCKCAAHEEFRQTEDVFYGDCLGRLIALPPILTDHYGGELAEALLPFILSKMDVSAYVRKCGLGSPYSVNFVLQMPSGRAFHFTGRPDFSLNAPHTGSVSRYTLRGIGEIQSPPQRKKESKTAALSQAGVYTVGQFAKEKRLGSYPAVVLHKDKTAQVAVATLIDRQASLPNSLGKVTFKLVGQIEPIDLKSADELRVFSGALRGIMNLNQPTVDS